MAPQVVPKTKGFPWFKNTAAVFVFGSYFTNLMEICSWGIQSGDAWGGGTWPEESRGEENESEQGEQGARRAPSFMQHNMLTHLLQRFLRLGFCVTNWFSSFEKDNEATCLTWFRGLPSFRWREASIASNDKNPTVAVFVIKQFVMVGFMDMAKFVHWGTLWIHPGQVLRLAKQTTNG